MHLNKIGQPSLMAAIACVNTDGAGRNKTGCETLSLLSNNGCLVLQAGTFHKVASSQSSQSNVTLLIAALGGK